MEEQEWPGADLRAREVTAGSRDRRFHLKLRTIPGLGRADRLSPLQRKQTELRYRLRAVWAGISRFEFNNRLSRKGGSMTVGTQASALSMAGVSGALPTPISGSSSSGTGQSAAITANDFLTLLVTEMKNQDPTATRDPNEYITQLVQVNSLQQLIGINDTLSAAYGTTTQGSATPLASPLSSPPSAGSVQSLGLPNQEAGTSITANLTSNSGNLSVPSSNPSAAGIASALNGRVGNIHTGIRGYGM